MRDSRLIIIAKWQFGSKQMESLELLSNFFKYLSDKNSINISLEYDAFNESQISQQDIEILAALKNTISSFNFVKNAKREEPKSFCSICKRKFAHPQLLKYHEKVLHNKLDNLADFNFSSLDIFVCINCNQCFKTKREFDSHLNCEKRFEIPPDLLSFHNKFSCGYCNESFKIFDRIEFHLKSISCQTNQRSQNSFQCQICSSEFKTKSSYHKHLFKSHQKVQVNFQCDQCPKKFIKKVYLTNHKLKFHNLEKNFMCSICGEKYLTEGTFKKHQKTHSNPVTFQCEFCPKTFKRKDKVSF